MDPKTTSTMRSDQPSQVTNKLNQRSYSVERQLSNQNLNNSENPPPPNQVENENKKNDDGKSKKITYLFIAIACLVFLVLAFALILISPKLLIYGIRFITSLAVVFITFFPLALVLFSPLWFINRLIVKRSWYTKSKLDTYFKYIIFSIFIGTHFLVLYLLATDPCELKGTCVESFMAGGFIFLITLFTGAFLLTLILPILIILPVKIEPTKLKTILKSPRYIGFIILIILMVYGNISIAYGVKQSDKRAIEKYQKEQAQRKLDEINYQKEHPEIARNDQRENDIVLISNRIIQFKTANNKFPENLAELKTSGFEVPSDPNTGESYRYFKNDTNGGYFNICARLEEDGPSPVLLCKKNGKSFIRKSDDSDAMMQYLVDREVNPQAVAPIDPTPTTSPQIIANDIKRQKDTLTILNAIYAYKAAHQGNLPKEIIPYKNNSKFNKINSGEVNLCMALVPAYLPAFPQDPALNNGKDITSCESYDSGYEISINEGNKVFVYAPHTQKPYTLIQSYR